MNRDRSILIPEGPVIPRQTYSLVKQFTTRDQLHAGLLLDKFSKFPKEDTGIQEEQCTALNEVCKIQGDSNLLSMLSIGRSQMLTASNAITLPMRTQGAMTLHLSRAGAWENAGISLHPIYGFVYLPGSGLKGLTRAWAETVWAPAQSDQKEAWRTIEEAFGYTPNSEKVKEETKKSGWRPSEIPVPAHTSTGQLIFHDAWPLKWPRLIVDIANSHHSKYYRGEQDPDDTENPNPVYFLAVGAGAEFEFAVSDRKLNSSALLDQGIEWLRDALTIQGAGAKTAAGYGRFRAEPPKPVHESPKIIRKEYDLELISMAFLAGANQNKQDCDLRPATLRGLLRWWWRTMHTAHVDLDTLRRLESAIWGDTDSGSPVQILLHRVRSSKPILFDKRRINVSPKIGQSERRKVTLGLAYASYGMDEINKSKQRRQRWYSKAGSKWHLTVNIRNGIYKSERTIMRLESDIILRQVEASIWLFTKYGGAGSRSRKGFGSFSDVKINGISSIIDCIDIGKMLRKECLINSSGHVSAPTLEDAIIYDESPTVTNDPVEAIDLIGGIIKEFSKELKESGRSRESLGLPRDNNDERHASPALWSLSQDNLSELRIQMIGFPSDKLHQSEQVLREIGDYAMDKINEKKKQFRPKRNPLGRSSSRDATTRQLHQDSIPEEINQKSSRLPSSGDIVMVVMLGDKTKKGNLKAEHIDSGLIGSMVDAHNAPADLSVGQEKKVFVHYANENNIAFRWCPPSGKSRTKRK